jgi:hypothetical protein
MADTNGATEKKAEAAARKQLGIRLVPASNSDQPVVSNYTNVNVAPGMVYIDFGFLEPAMLSALPRVASQGKLPESVNGKLAVRVAMGYDALATMNEQLSQVLQGLKAAIRARQQPAK